MRGRAVYIPAPPTLQDQLDPLLGIAGSTTRWAANTESKPSRSAARATPSSVSLPWSSPTFGSETAIRIAPAYGNTLMRHAARTAAGPARAARKHRGGRARAGGPLRLRVGARVPQPLGPAGACRRRRADGVDRARHLDRVGVRAVAA